jgi:hypothetical protein
MSFQGIKKEDCGASLLVEYGSNKYIGNACFFCCVYTSLIANNPDDPGLLTLSYKDFLQVGGWTKEKTGKMVDTFYDAVQLNKLASHFEVTILVYTELSPNIVYTDAYNRFGSGDRVIRIVKVHNNAHFNLMTWDNIDLTIEEVSKAEKKLQAQIKKDLEMAIKLDAEIKKALVQEEADFIYASELEIALKMAAIQEASDFEYAKKMAQESH